MTPWEMQYRRIDPGESVHRTLVFPLELEDHRWFDQASDLPKRDELRFYWKAAAGTPFVLSLGYLKGDVPNAERSPDGWPLRTPEDDALRLVHPDWALNNFEMRVMIRGHLSVAPEGAPIPEEPDWAAAYREGGTDSE